MAAPERWWLAIKAHSTDIKIIESAAKPTGYETVLGPFATRQQAEQSRGQIGRPRVNQTAPSIPNPLSGIGAVAHWIGKAVLDITDAAMWRSLGWLALGALLVIAGIYLWFRTSGTYKDLQSAVLGTVKAL